MTSSVFQKSPFQARLNALNIVQQWTSWNGYKSAQVFDTIASEYFAIRSTCSLMDLTPMEKYRITGPDSQRFLNRLVTRDLSKLAIDRVAYVIWCNDEGKVLDDGTVFRLGENDFRLCAQHHQLDWLSISRLGFNVNIEKETDDIAALAVQGPTSFSVLSNVGLEDLDKLKPFQICRKSISGIEIMISRTGFTGDLGYELWTSPEKALDLWDLIYGQCENGNFDIRAIGLQALNMVRIEAGFIMPGEDFVTAETAVRADRSRSPFELGLSWLVDFEKPYFTGKTALQAEALRPATRRLVKLLVEGNKPPADAFLYDKENGKRIGTVKSCVWSPILKANLTLSDIEFKNGSCPKRIWAEIYYQKELEWKSSWSQCHVSNKPFWKNARASITPPMKF